eukprot:TRINITY_DN23661_c0_g1_i1.p1 TRINITY_DN23661_c0_g1~~TRINITY_DN23661_c0_g1_i1.p1  ORF type:complete len:1192 (-),score=165.37 TRINITY_DN23661_c0_g1_i1:274-3816(-)
MADAPCKPSFIEALRQVESSFEVVHKQILSVKESIGVLSDVSASLHSPAESEKAINPIPIQSKANHADGTNGKGASSVLVEPIALCEHWRQAAKTPSKKHVPSTQNLVTGRSTSIELHPVWRELATKTARILQTRSTEISIKAMSTQKSSRRTNELVGSNRLRTSIYTTVKRVSGIGMDTSVKSPEITLGLRRVDFSCPSFPVMPHGKPRIVWDSLGLNLLFVELVVLPLTLAWNIEPDATAGGKFLSLLSWSAAIFWMTDMAMNSVTAYYEAGCLVTSWRKILKHYAMGWFGVDIVIVLLDVLMLAAPQLQSFAGLRSARAVRALRAMRLLRVFKVNKLAAIIEEATFAAGRQWVLVLGAMIKIAVIGIVATHFMTCVWFYIGLTTSEEGQESWLVKKQAEQVEMGLQYLQSLVYIIAPPSPPPIDVDSPVENFVHVVIVLFVWSVVGSSVGRVTSIIAELRAINSERTMKRREVRAYLHSQRTPLELTSRIMRFVDHTLKQQQASVAVDLSLISPTLQSELHLNQRGNVFAKHPLFALIGTLFQQVYAEICGAFKKQVFDKGETVFQMGQFSTLIYFTADSGRFDLISDVGDVEAVVDAESRWFNELGLFIELSTHDSSLVATTFSDVFTLSGEELRTCIQNDTDCVGLMCEYAKDFVTLIARKGEHGFRVQEECSWKACKQNRYYRNWQPDQDLLLETIEIKQAAVPDDAEIKDACELVRHVQSGFEMSQAALAETLQMLLPEIHPQHGTYMIFAQTMERERSESGCLSILNLVADQFEEFRSPQTADKLTQDQWHELRQILAWIQPDEQDVHAALVLLAIYLLGKCTRLVEQLPETERRAERAVLYILSKNSQVAPSVKSLPQKGYELIYRAVQLHDQFNFAQMLQGENTPANVRKLQELLQEDIHLFRFYILFLLGFMSGLAAGRGSRFMSSNNAKPIIGGCRTLQSLMKSTPQAIYWSVILGKALQLRRPTETATDLVLIRLACLSRVQDEAAFMEIQDTWNGLSRNKREILMNHFLADGITHRAFLLKFLPLCIGNALVNPLVKLHSFFEVLVELLQMLAVFVDYEPALSDTKLIQVDLADFADFIKIVQNRYVFETCISRCQFRVIGSQTYIDMSHKNWSRCNEPETDMTSLAHSVKDVLNRFEVFEAAVTKRTLPRMTISPPYPDDDIFDL